MTWEYLLTKEFNHRIMLIAGFLAGKVYNKHIVDLNCGHAPLLDYLPHTFSHYIGNDTLCERLPKNTQKTTFLCVSDDKFVSHIEKCDILLALGYTSVHSSQHESKTFEASIHAIVKTHKPQYVIVEAILPYRTDVDKLDLSDYNTLHEVIVCSAKQKIGMVSERYIKILCKIA